MIRLNDTYKTVIDEKEIKVYSEYKDNMFDKEIEAISLLVGKTHINFRYDSQEARDKDIELLDKIFDVKSIEDKANAYPHEVDALKFAMSGIKKESEPVKKAKPEIRVNIKQEEKCITWGDVCQLGSLIVELPNGGIVKCTYNPQADNISFSSPTGDKKDDGYIYNEDLFNALKLKRAK